MRIASLETASRTVGDYTEEAMIDMARLDLDPSGAYAVTSHTAEASHARFVAADYTLRSDERGEPVWIVTLLSESSRPVGTIYIGATRGTVRRTEGMFAGATDRKSTRLNSSHVAISYAVFCLKKKQDPKK